MIKDDSAFMVFILKRIFGFEDFVFNLTCSDKNCILALGITICEDGLY